jgi:hypothetical protein
VHSRLFARGLAALAAVSLLAAAGVATVAAPALADNPSITLTAPAPGNATITVQLPVNTGLAFGALVDYAITVTCENPFGNGNSPFLLLESQNSNMGFSPNPSDPASWTGDTYTGSALLPLEAPTADVSLLAVGPACFNSSLSGPIDSLTADPATKPAADAPWNQVFFYTPYVGRPSDGNLHGPEGDSYTYAISGPVPPGMDMRSYGTVYWVPTTPGPVSFVVVATDAVGNQWTKTITANVLPPLSWVKSTVAPFVTGLSYSDYVTGPFYGQPYEPLTYALTSGALPNGLTLGQDGTITGTPDDQPGTYNYQITVTDVASYTSVLNLSTELLEGPGPNSPWVNSTVPDLQYGHAMSVQLAGPANDSYTYSYTGTLPTGLVLLSDGTISGSSQDAPGAYPLQVTATDPYGTHWVKTVTLTLGAEKPWVNSTLPNAIIGSPYSAQIIAPDYGLTYTYSSVLYDYDHTQPSAARVLWIVYGDDGTISGTPNVSSTGTVIQVTATDSEGNVFTTLVNLETTGVPPVWSTSALPALYPGIPVSSSVTAGGDDVAYSVVAGAMPSGLALNSDGTFSGSPVMVGPYDVTIRAERDGAHSDQEFAGSVLPPSATLTPGFGVGSSIDLTVDVDAAGLAPGSDWSLELHSTPTIIGSGVVAGDGSFFSTVTIPAGTPAGAHELILSGVSPSGAAVTAHAWFTLGRNGTILAISFTGPTPGLAALASTGAPDVSGALLTGVLALLAGAALLLVRRRRAR